MSIIIHVKQVQTQSNINVLSEFDEWGQALPRLTTNFWIRAIYGSYL